MADEQRSLIDDPFAPASGVRPFETGTIRKPPPATRPASLIMLEAPDRLQDAARRAPATPPDRAARVLRLQGRTGLPLDLIERNLNEVEQQSAASDFDPDRFRATSPRFARWLEQHPAHLALAQDDVRPLSALERTLGIGRNIAGAAAASTARFSRWAWSAIEQGAETMHALQPEDTGAPWGPLAGFARESANVAGHLADRLRGPQTGAGPLERFAYSGVESAGLMVPSIVAGVVGGPVAALGVIGVGTMGEAFHEARAEGLGVAPATGFGAFQGTVEVATEFLPAERFLKDLARKTPIVQTIVHQLVPELVGENVATVLQDLAEWAVLPSNRDRPLMDYVRDRPSAAVATTVSTLVALGTQTAVTHGTVKVLEQVGALAREAQTTTRAPEAMRDLVDQLAPTGTVLLPIDTFTSYFQSKGLNPAAIAERLTGDADAFRQAQTSGEDLVAPMSRYVVELAGTEHHAFFTQEARLQPMALNVRETQALEAEVAAQIGTATTEAPAVSSSAGQVRDAVLAHLESAGLAPQTAKTYAALYEALFQTIGTRAGVDPFALFERYGLQVTRASGPTAPVPSQTGDTMPIDVPASVARPGETAPQRAERTRSQWAELRAAVLRDARTVDPSVDPAMINAEFASRRSRFEDSETMGRESGRDPKTLLQAIADYGGLWWEKSGAYKGEIDVMKESQTAPDTWGGVKGVFRKAGKSPDVMLEALREDPRFAHIEDLNALLDAVDAAVREPVTPETIPGSDALRDTLGIRLGSRWWDTAAPASDEDTRFFQFERGQITFGKDRQFRIELFAGADLSTFIHESAHFFLEIVGDVVDQLGAQDLATLTDTQRRLLSDYGAILQWLGVDRREAVSTAQHEQFARAFEAYLLEGAAPSSELRSAFARVRAWLVSLYRTVRSLNVEVSPEIRAVLDRLLATDEAIDAAIADQHVQPIFSDPAIADAAGLSPAEREAFQATVDAASAHARERVQAQLLAQLQRERAAWWREERANVRQQVAPAVFAQPVYRALALLQRGTQPDGTPLPAGTEGFKLSQELLTEQFGPGVLARLPRPLVYTTRTGVPPAIAAELLGFPNSTSLMTALIGAPPMDAALDTAADAEMRQRHGDLLLDGAILEHARAAVLEAGGEVFAAELTALTAAATRQVGRPGAPVAPVSTLRAIAERRIADTPIRDVRPAVFSAAARRAGDQALAAAARQDFRAALQAKQKQVLSAELFKAATAARTLVEDAIAGFKPIFGREATLAARYNLDLVNAARSLLAQFELAPPAQGAAAHVYLDQVRRYDADLFADLTAAIEAAAQPAQPYRDLTVDGFIALRDAVSNLWFLARRSKQMVVEGRKAEIAEVRAELGARLEAIDTPTARVGYDRAITKWQKTRMYLLGLRASLRRVESWADAIDGGQPGAFRRVWFTPISEAGTAYRLAKKAALERYLAIVKGVEASLTPFEIAAPEIHYTFEGKIELLHALLHVGNRSNFSKLLRGRQWGFERPDGTLDSSRWDAFIARLWQQGTLTKTDMDYVQAVWDLFEDLKPQAQRVHHELYGFFFAEITADPVSTPVGQYRGGYMPAIVDPFLATDAAIRADKETLESTPNSFLFPTAGRGFTKGRVEMYAKPLALDLRVVPAHLDRVLRFIHFETAVKDASRLVMDRGMRRALDAFDPTVASELLLPFLQRGARQSVDTPAQGWGGRGMDRFWRALRRRTGMQIMVGNVLNTLQQFTGLSVAAVKVPIPALTRALWRYVRQPAKLTALVTEKSDWMRTRTTTQTMEVQQHLDDLLLHPSKYEELRAFTQKHGYFLQAATQSIVDLVVWSGGYDAAVAGGATELEAVRQGDAAVRQTQGSFNPEDLSTFETGTPGERLFRMFYSYFNGLANLLGSEFAIVARTMGLKEGAGRALYLYTFGFMLPAVVSELIVAAGRGRLDEDDDGALDDLLALFFGAQARTATAMVPWVGTAANALINTFNDKRYDDRISVSPAISAIESAVHAPVSVYRAIVNDGRRKQAVRDTLTLLGLLTGLPVATLGRPLGYLADVAEERVEPTGPVDAARGLVVGR